MSENLRGILFLTHTVRLLCRGNHLNFYKLCDCFISASVF